MKKKYKLIRADDESLSVLYGSDIGNADLFNFACVLLRSHTNEWNKKKNINIYGVKVNVTRSDNKTN